ncbi:MAG: DEAD/DEAH box helicase [Firmicutes bacterium]|nr:DEAD/DEAH box helicase [Bacillota bacterium]
MIVLHLAFDDGNWFLWGETPAGEENPARRRGRKPKTWSAQTSPYDAGQNLLAETLAACGIEKKPLKTATVVAWLPTAKDCPVASSLLVAQPPASEEKEIKPWKVTAVPLTAGEVVTFLAICLSRRTLAPGIVLGREVVYWTQVLRFTGSLMARERFLPGVEKREGQYYAYWQPVLTGDDLKRLKLLSEAMPAVCRALTAGDLPPATPLSLLNRCLGRLLDAAVRMGSGEADRPISFDSLHDRWVYALKSADGKLVGQDTALAGFAAQVKEWQRKVFFLSAAPFRLCFRLEEPDREEQPGKKKSPPQWQVSYLLQAADDPSLLVPVKEAWPAGGQYVELFRERHVTVPELVLTALGQATAICPRIEESLKTAVPAGYALDTAGAYEFLTEKASFLEQAGFGVLVPGWWTKKGPGVRLAVRAKVNTPGLAAPGKLPLDEVVDFNWEIALGEEALSREELARLAKAKSPLVQLRGRWVAVDAGTIQSLLKNWQKTERFTARDIVRMSLGAARTPGNLPLEGITVNGWLSELLAQLEGKTPWQEADSPRGLRGQLRAYQSRGYSWLYFLSQLGFGACLADDMGLGKTIQTLALIQQYRERGEKHPVLLICPTSLIGNWQREAARFTPDLLVMVHHGGDRMKDRDAFQKEAAGYGMVISSYSLLHRDIHLWQGVDWAGVILDEAQNIKNPHTKQAQAARALKAGFKVALTGTPVENNVGDLWSLSEFLNPGLVGSLNDFKRHFFIPIQVNRDHRAAEKLKRLTGPFILRRLKTNQLIISDLPEKMEMKVFTTLTREQASLYAAVIKEAEAALAEAEGIQRKGLVLATLTKLKQICNHPAQFLQDGSAIHNRSGKLARLAEMLEEILSVNERSLIFTQFTEMGEMLRRYLTEVFGREVLFLHGGLAKKERDRLVELFQSEQGPPFFILSIKAGGTGLNLTRANHVFHFDRWWNPAVENQATDRAFRIGQTKLVQVHKFVCAGTVEEKIDALIEGKKEVAGQVVGTGEGWLTELSTDQLKELWSLRQEAIGE